nr:Phytopthora agathidicda GPCR-INPP 2 [Phytophthora agathidicida]
MTSPSLRTLTDDTTELTDQELSSSQLDILHTVILTCCALSLGGCLYIVRHHYVSARLHSGVSMVQKMVVVLSLFDAGLSFPKMFGNPLTTDVITASCNVQAFALNLFGLMSVFWNAAIAHCFYRKIVHRDSEARLKSRFKLYLLLVIVPAVACSVALYAARLFGDATFYCWVESRSKQFWAFYLFVVGAILYISVILWVTHNRISRDFRDANLDAQESWALITSKLRIYIAAFIVLWTPSTVFRLFDNELGSAKFAIALLMQVTVCTQGLTTAIIYGGLLTRLYRIVSCKSSISPTRKLVTSPTFPTMDTGTDHSLVKHYRRPANIFVSTFNMGEARLTPAMLDKWIPRGHDIYVIGLQECLHLANTRSLIRQHLEGGRPRPAASGPARRASTFHQFNREIGSKNTSLGYHGHIAITVFIKSSDVDNGAFYMPPVVQQEVNVGKSLVLGRASNKGAVGFAFRYYDTSFAFVACHLSSDPKGKSKVRRRNRDSQDILKELHLNLEDVGFEFPHVHHHSFVLGDLNYRLTQRDASADTILELVSKVRQCETAKPAPIKRNRSLRRGLLGRRWSPMPSRGLSNSFGLGSSLGAGSDRDSNDLDVSMLEHSVKSSSEALASSNGSSNNSVRYSADCELVDDDQFTWDDVLIHDELRTGMRDEQIFYGFREAKIAFPPTFRRVRGAALNLDAGSWPMEELAGCYTTAVEGHGMRVPSYTDRILHFSQPDMRHRLRCAVYASCEEVNCSDHKPVLAVFQALVNRDVLPIETELATKKLQRMQDVSGVLECQLRLDFCSVSWQPDTEVDFPLTSFGSSIDIDQRFSNYDRHGHQVMVTIVFPLPSEDIFSAQRKLLELADSMSGGVYLENTDRLLCKTNVAHVRWADFVRDGITHATFARPTGNMHVAIKVHAGTQGPCFGQGVICIPQAPNEDSDGEPMDGIQKLNNFVVELADGGRHTGTMSGSVSLHLLQRPSGA